MRCGRQSEVSRHRLRPRRGAGPSRSEITESTPVGLRVGLRSGGPAWRLRPWGKPVPRPGPGIEVWSKWAFTSMYSTNPTNGWSVSVLVTLAPRQGRCGVRDGEVNSAGLSAHIPKGWDIGPAGCQVYCCFGVHHTEAVLVVKVVAVRGGAILQGTGLPSGIAWVVLAGGGCQDQLHIPPRQGFRWRHAPRQLRLKRLGQRRWYRRSRPCNGSRCPWWRCRADRVCQCHLEGAHTHRLDPGSE